MLNTILILSASGTGITVATYFLVTTRRKRKAIEKQNRERYDRIKSPDTFDREIPFVDYCEKRNSLIVPVRQSR